MKIFAAALIALGGLAATATLAQAQDFDHHHRHHGPVIIVDHRHHSLRDMHRHHDWHNDHHRFPRRAYHEYNN